MIYEIAYAKLYVDNLLSSEVDNSSIDELYKINELLNEAIDFNNSDLVKSNTKKDDSYIKRIKYRYKGIRKEDYGSDTVLNKYESHIKYLVKEGFWNFNFLTLVTLFICSGGLNNIFHLIFGASSFMDFNSNNYSRPLFFLSISISIALILILIISWLLRFCLPLVYLYIPKSRDRLFGIRHIMFNIDVSSEETHLVRIMRNLRWLRLMRSTLMHYMDNRKINKRLGDNKVLVKQLYKGIDKLYNSIISNKSEYMQYYLDLAKIELLYYEFLKLSDNIKNNIN